MNSNKTDPWHTTGKLLEPFSISKYKISIHGFN